MFAAGKTAAVSGAGPDDKFNYVTMLLHGDGTNGAQNNTFLDSSTNNFTITRNGNTTQGSFSPYGSNWSVFCTRSATASSNTRLQVASNAGLGLQSNDFCIELWAYFSSEITTGDAPFCTNVLGSGYISNTWYFGPHGATSGKVTVYIYNNSSSTYLMAESTTPPINQWVHYALVRNGNTFTIYRNGTSTVSATFSGAVSGSTSALNIARSGDGTGGNTAFGGYLSNLRVVNGSSVYTSNFTPPTSPLTAITNTGLLTLQSNRFIDNSAYASAITVDAGTPSVERFNPFGASTAYSTSVIGGSGYFDGSGDYLTAASTTAFDIASGTDFTFSCWVYFTSNPNNGTTKYIFDQTSTSGSGSVIFLAQESTNAWTACSMANAYSSSDFVAGQWYWITISRVSGTLRSFKNGTLITSGSNTDASDTNRFTIAARYSDNYILNSAYLTDVRFVVGSGVTSDTVPTAPPTAITNTALLCNMTNGAIFDNAMMNDLETVGNAQISTSVVKYGTGSLAFDGSGDWLLGQVSQNLSFGTGDFTIEGWGYVTSIDGTYRCIISIGAPVQIYALSGTIEVYFNDSDDQSSYIVSGMNGPASSVSANTWFHFAVVRNGTTFTAYVNGVAGTPTTGVSAQVALSAYPFALGIYLPSSSYPFTGYIDDLRITKGYARYTANFTPPTAAFSNTGPI